MLGLFFRKAGVLVQKVGRSCLSADAYNNRRIGVLFCLLLVPQTLQLSFRAKLVAVFWTGMSQHVLALHICDKTSRSVVIKKRKRLLLIYNISLNDWYTFLVEVRWNFKKILAHRYRRDVTYCEIANWWYISIFTSRLHSFQKWLLPKIIAFALLSTRDRIHAPLFSGPLENGFIRIHLPPPPFQQRWSDNSESRGCVCKKRSSGHLVRKGRTPGGLYVRSNSMEAGAEEKSWVKMQTPSVWQVLC